MAIKRVVISGLGLVLALVAADAHAKLFTIEEAKKISKDTGRPIFAVAGTAT